MDLDDCAVSGEVEIHRTADGAVEFGYWVCEVKRRRGFALEALSLLVKWASVVMPGDNIELSVHPGNVAGRAVAKRAGFDEIGTYLSPHLVGNTNELAWFRYPKPGATQVTPE